jgi:wyosine [tRNA(Phe)-imidazoG37] synthetase (radical SAM superfamily)
MDIAFGPVPSRRLGRSLGINNIPPKHCSYSCIYCQVGPTKMTEIAPRAFYSPEEIRRQVGVRLADLRERGERVDYLTFVPDGEPTLDCQLSEAIDALRGLGLPIAVISNASLIGRTAVRAALARADWVSVKIDCIDESGWRHINRPHPELRLADILSGIRAFAGTFRGTLVSETMLIDGINDSEETIEALARFLTEAGIARAYLAIPHRPPAVSGVHGPDEAVVTRAHACLEARCIKVALLSSYEGEDFALSGDFRRDLLAITAVHPLRESAVRALAEKAHVDLSMLARLLDSGQLRRVVYAGEPFYIRCPHQDSAPPCRDDENQDLSCNRDYLFNLTKRENSHE